MKGKTPNIVRYNMPNNKATRACLAQKPQYLLLYSYNDAEQPLQLFLIDRNRRWSKEKMMATGYENPHHDEYVVLYLTKEIPLAKLLVQPLRDFASKKLMFLLRFNPFVLSGNEILQANPSRTLRWTTTLATLSEQEPPSTISKRTDVLMSTNNTSSRKSPMKMEVSYGIKSQRK